MDKLKISTLAEGDIVLNKVTMRKARVIAVAKESCVASIACEGPKLSGKTTELAYIAPENAVCFRLLERSKMPAPVPEAYVRDDGTAVINNREVKGGNLHFSGVLFTLPGHVVLLTEKDATGSVSAVFYEVKDGAEFSEPRHAATVPAGSSLRKFTVGSECFLYEERREIREIALENGGCERKEYFRGAYLYCLSVQDGRLTEFVNSASHPLLEGEGRIVGSSLSADGIPKMVAFASGEEVNHDTGEITTADKEHVIIFRGNIVHGCLTEDVKVAIDVDDAESLSAVDSLYGLVIRSDRELLIENGAGSFIRIFAEGTVRELAKYPCLVSAKTVKCGQHYILVFADESLRTVAADVEWDSSANGRWLTVLTWEN